MFQYGTCDKLAALQVVGVTDVVIAEASDTIVVEGLDVPADVCVELEAAIWSFQHLLNNKIQKQQNTTSDSYLIFTATTRDLCYFHLPSPSCWKVQDRNIFSSTTG